MTKQRQPAQAQSGFSMIEVLVTLVILVFGLLGLAGLQTKAQVAETESYQRMQALVLVRDIADRINANRVNAVSYAFAATAPLGQGSGKDCSAPTTTADKDLCDWDAALKGAAESSGGNSVGTLLGGRGCVTATANLYLVQVVWQGLASTAAPPTQTGTAPLLPQCGVAYTSTTRMVTSVVQIGTLSP